VPSNPQKVYQNEWHGTSHWLGIAAASQASRSPAKGRRQIAAATTAADGAAQLDAVRVFSDARLHVAPLQLASYREWLAWCRSSARTPSIPTRPDRWYRHAGWRGWQHWLSAGSSVRDGPAAKLAPTRRKGTGPNEPAPGPASHRHSRGGSGGGGNNAGPGPAGHRPGTGPTTHPKRGSKGAPAAPWSRGIQEQTVPPPRRPQSPPATEWCLR